MIAPRENRGNLKRPAARSIGFVRLAVWAVVGIAVAAVAYWFVNLSPEQQAERKERKNRAIAVVEHVKISPAVEEETAKEGKVSKPLPPQKPHEVRDGMLMLSNGELLPTNKLRKVSIEDRKPRFKYAIFDHPTDNELAAILTLKPGQALIGGPIRHNNYKEDFLKSIETPIIISADDPDDVKDVKRAVINARMALKDAIDAGEDPAEIIRESYEEAQKLSLYKEDVQREISSMVKDGDYTDEEVDDIIAAANVILETKGIAPMNIGPVIKARLRTLKQ